MHSSDNAIGFISDASLHMEDRYTLMKLFQLLPYFLFGIIPVSYVEYELRWWIMTAQLSQDRTRKFYRT